MMKVYGQGGPGGQMPNFPGGQFPGQNFPGANQQPGPGPTDADKVDW